MQHDRLNNAIRVLREECSYYCDCEQCPLAIKGVCRLTDSSPYNWQEVGAEYE